MRWKEFAAVAAFVAALGSAQPARAGFLDEAGWGSLTVLANVVYMPAKLVYATLGGITGGLALGLTGGDMDTADAIWTTSMGGNYVLTPQQLRGEDSISIAGTPGVDAQPADTELSPPPLDDDVSQAPAFSETDLGS